MARKSKKEVSAIPESPEVTVRAEVAEKKIPAKKGLTKVIVTPEQLAQLQVEKLLYGYDPITCEATIL